MSQYFISVSISELQQWLADDRIPVLNGRIYYSKSGLVEESAEFELERLFKCLPAFSLDDPAGVLIVEVAGPDTWEIDEDPNVRHLELSVVKKFIPLTEDARAALSVNWTSVIELSPAVFGLQFELFRLRKKRAYSNKAGNLFACVFMSYEPKEYAAAEHFDHSLLRAVMAAEQKKPDEIERILEKQKESFLETWIERAFHYTRRDKFDKAENLKCFIDAGRLLKEISAVDELTNKLRDTCKRLGESAKGCNKPLAFFCEDSELSLLKANLNVGHEDGPMISLLTLALFLRWKQAFHDQRSTVNLDSIMNDVSSLVGKVDAECVAIALWMMGAYLGMDNIAPIHRYLNQEKYPALRFSGKEGRLVPIPVWRFTKSEALLDEPASPDCAQSNEPNFTPENQIITLANADKEVSTDVGAEHHDSGQPPASDLGETSVTAPSIKHSQPNSEPSLQDTNTLIAYEKDSCHSQEYKGTQEKLALYSDSDPQDSMQSKASLNPKLKSKTANPGVIPPEKSARQK